MVGTNSLSEGVPNLRGLSKTCFWRRRSSKVCFTLNLWLQSFWAVLSILFFCRAKEGYWLCPLRCRMFLMLPLLQYPIAKVTFKELQHCQNHRQRPQRGAEKMYKFSDAPLARPNLHIPRLSRGSCRQGAADRGIFSFKKIREQRLWRLILSVLCLFVPFWAPKRKDRNYCPKWLQPKIKGKNYPRIQK